jgi:hypothetical protein
MRDDGNGNRRRRPWAITLVVALATTLTTLTPRPAGAVEALSSAQIEAMISSLARKIAAEDDSTGTPIDATMAALLIRSKTRTQALIDVDASCPIAGTVANLTTHPLYNVVVTATESSTKMGGGIESTIHIAYLPAKSLVRVSFPCKTSSLGYGVKYISGDGFGESSPITMEGVAEMITQRADSAAGLGGTYSASSGVSGSIADQVLKASDADEGFRDLVTTLLKTEQGGAAVGRFAASGAFGEKATQLVPLLAGAPRLGAIAAFEAMMTEGVDSASPSVKALVDKVCGAGQAERDRAALWTRALSGMASAGAPARALILKKCAGTAAQTATRLKMATPTELAAALDALDGPGFDAALDAINGPPMRTEAITGLLRVTTDPKKLAAVTRRYPLSGFTSSPAIRELVLGVAGADAGSLDSEKAAIVAGGLDRLHELADADASKLIGDLAALVAHGKVTVTPIRSVIGEHAAAAPEAVKSALAAVAREESRVLTPEWLLARVDKKELDLQAFLDFNREELGSCTGSSTQLQVCLSQLPKAAPGLSREAFSPGFVATALNVVGAEDDAGDIVNLAKGFGAVGLDTKPIVDRVCSKADAAARHSPPDEDTVDKLLGAATSIDSSAACVGEVRSAVRWRAASAAGSVALRLLVLLVTIGIGILYIRRTWAAVRVKVRAANLEVANAQAEGGGERRLDAATWSQEITAGLADVTRTLGGETSEDLRAAAAVLRDIPAEARVEIVKRARLAANATIRSGDVSSLLVKLPTALVYIVCFAGRAEQPQTVRRHAAFRDGWEAHAARVREAALAGGPELPLLGLLFFLHADAVKGTLLIALEGQGAHVVPERLLGEREARARAGQISRYHHDFELERATAALPAADGLATAEG